MYDVVIALGVCSLLYLAVLLAKRVDFAFIWLVIGGFFLAAGGYWRYCALHPGGFRLPGYLTAALAVLAAAGFAVFAAVEGLILKEMLEKPQADLDVLIVLGAQVRGEQPSLALWRRLEAAEDYLKKNPRTLAVLSGGQGDGEDITEAECMRRYLTAHGVDEGRLIVEDRSTTTLENLLFSREKIAQINGDGWHQKTGLLSNNFHIFRARLLAQKCGYTDVQGVPAKSDWRLQAHYLVREFFALGKEKLSGHI